jgi:two-component system response regulator HydG
VFLARRYTVSRSRQECVGMSPPVAEKMMNYSWPGNVRELQNWSAVAFTRFAELTVDDLPEKIRDYKSSNVTIPVSALRS